MSSGEYPTNSECQKERIAAYFDGDLPPLEERSAAEHIAGCGVCAEYLNSLKMVSTSLEIFLDKEPVRIPGEFSKRVTAAAGSNMDGLRSSRERSRAVMVTAGLLLIAAVAVALNAVGVGPSASQLPGKIIAFAGLIGHFFYDAATGFSVIFGTICSKFLFGSSVAVVLILGLLIFSIFVFSKHIMRLIRS